MMRPEVGALIGSYDDDPDAPTTISRFKNLAHHHFHQRSRTEATSFWGGCGLVRRDLFVAAGGFDYDQPETEDGGPRSPMISRGLRIALHSQFPVKDLQAWIHSSLLTSY